MATLTNSSDFAKVRNEQMTTAQDLFGRDPEASAIGNKVRPYTPPDYAKLVFADWGATFHTAVAKEVDSNSELGVVGQTLIAHARDAKRLMTDEEMNLIRADSPMPLTTAMRNALIRMQNAANGATKLSPARVRVLTGQNCAAFWDAAGEYGINCGATRAVVTSGERWSAFFDGLNDSAVDIAEGVGQVAANVARTAGQAIGAGASGFFGELGVVESVIIIGAGVAMFKVL